LQVINQEASQPGPRLDYLFDTYIKPIRDFGEAWLTRLADEGHIAPTSVTLLYFLMTHGAGGLFAMPALTQKLENVAKKKTKASIRRQAEGAVSVIFDGMLSRPHSN
jgi:hypothetical protein